MPELPKSERPETDPADNHRIPLARPGRGASRRRRAEILRVDHAGEYAAVHIYRAQRAVFEGRAGREAIAADMGEMQAQEAVHLARFDALLNAERVRPTLMTPVWRLAALALGTGTALMGEKAAHACTEAVESVIEEHYADQIAELGDRDPALAAELSVFREEELVHHGHAVEHGAREAPGYRLLSAVIKAGCRAAIKVSERV
ncbi:MAG: demethoxyubiquinone hydroxylase family protein [Alphaproteobacteria bacterium]|jgi:3-demethoxyubiquinol 3-hydroxylase|nr:demethoxyubiquinone hydroxylase family protein [Alphaproteobacteria bacterium]MBU2041835.1 demethoxyubiquinone hydroxylase family protein [Alphaproteobacteria bacterium]MBU2127201.1 demethoxyubiquinone hydroxylase family protein [Alphaproteobacteria bacterium]MBU2207976.1 demethoxyubiquinone hydroxylase family protein [Alphaproteobacteria bacterium]MBU2289548.1 demethoxyubiquinone hydroxylase family protein [Alphaproteobacteria bacterium]